MHRLLWYMHQAMMHQLLCSICHVCDIDIAMGTYSMCMEPRYILLTTFPAIDSAKTTTYYGCISSNCRYEIVSFQLYMKLYHPFVNPR